MDLKNCPRADELLHSSFLRSCNCKIFSSTYRGNEFVDEDGFILANAVGAVAACISTADSTTGPGG